MQANIVRTDSARASPIAELAPVRPAAPGAMRAMLKRSTHSLHIEVERLLDLPARTRDLTSYRALLEAFLGFYRPLEERLARVAAYATVGLDFEPRRKSALLEKDLATLGMDMTARDSVPLCDELPEVEDLPGALGCLYVLEGSTLGGKVINRMVADRLGLTPETGTAFFACYGERALPMWAEFCACLDTCAQAGSSHSQRMIVAAHSTFQTMGRWIARGSA